MERKGHRTAIVGAVSGCGMKTRWSFDSNARREKLEMRDKSETCSDLFKEEKTLNK